jgi:vesicle transport protein SEC22
MLIITVGDGDGGGWDRYIIVRDVVYLVLCDKSYPKKLAYSYLEELSKEFDQCYGSEVASAQRPYQFIKFGMCRCVVEPFEPTTRSHDCASSNVG